MNKINKLQLKGANPNSKVFKAYKDSLLQLTQEQWEASIGLMLGDASLQTQNKRASARKTFRMKFEWSEKNKAYIDHVYNLFDEWVISEPHKKERFSPQGNLVTNYGFQTISHKAFNPLAELFLSENKKGVSPFLIKDNLTARGLAYWFMDDGGKLDYNKSSKNKSIVLNTQSFLDQEVQMMATELNQKFKLECSLRTNKGKKIIVIDSQSYSQFRELIDPYMLDEMNYKLP